MKPLSFTLSAIVLSLMAVTAQGQSIARVNGPTAVANSSRQQTAMAMAALKRLEKLVIVYRSLGDFEAEPKLAHVPLPVFERELLEVSQEIEPELASLPASKSRNHLINALASYRDGLFWWRKIDRPRVVNVSALSYSEPLTSADAAFTSTVPYTVAIHWRQASRYLKQAEASLNQR